MKQQWNAAGGIACLFLICSATTSAEAPSADQRVGPNGGNLHRIEGRQCEVVFSERALRIHVRDQHGQPVSTEKLRGRLCISRHGFGKKQLFDLYPEIRKTGPHNRLFLAVRLPREPAKVDVSIYGLDSLPDGRLKFTTRFDGRTSLERLAVRNQQKCPVTGQRLGAMGRPVKVALEQRDIYVCCKGCVPAVRKQPQRYLKLVSQRRTR